MAAAAKESGVRLCVNHQLRFGRTVRALKAEVDAGRFGKLFHGTVQIRRNRNQAYFDAAKWRGTWAQDGGTLMNQCIHYTDLLQWLMGDVEEVFAYTDRLAHPYIEAEDMGLTLVKFRSGAYGMIEGTVNVYPRNLSDSLALFGETGTVSLEGKTLDDVRAWNFADAPHSRDDALCAFDIPDMGGGHVPVYRDVIRAIQENREPLCIEVGSNARISIGAVATKNVPDGATVTGNFAIPHATFLHNLKASLSDSSTVQNPVAKKLENISGGGGRVTKLCFITPQAATLWRVARKEAA